MWLKRYMQFNFCKIMATLKVLYSQVRFASVKAHLSELKTSSFSHTIFGSVAHKVCLENTRYVHYIMHELSLGF